MSAPISFVPKSKDVWVAPEWCRLTREYLNGNVRAGYRAQVSISRWLRRYDSERKRGPG